MRQCADYEEAFHYDCACCDEECPFRKGTGIFWLLFFYVLIVIVPVLIVVL